MNWSLCKSIEWYQYGTTFTERSLQIDFRILLALYDLNNCNHRDSPSLNSLTLSTFLLLKLIVVFISDLDTTKPDVRLSKNYNKNIYVLPPERISKQVIFSGQEVTIKTFPLVKLALRILLKFKVLHYYIACLI